MTDRFVAVPRPAYDLHIGDPIRHLPAARIAAALAGRIKADIANAGARLSKDSWIQMIATDHAGTRAIAQVQDIRYHASAADAVKERGDDVLLEGETAAEFLALEDSQRGDDKVISYSLTRVQPAPAQRQAIPPPADGMRLYDVVHFQAIGGTGEMGILSVHATDLDEARKIVTSARSGKEIPDAQLAQAQSYATNPETRVIVDIMRVSATPTTVSEFSFNSTPLLLYASADDLAEDPEILQTDGCVQLPWRNVRLLITQGREAIRCLLYRAFGHLVLVYERQIEVLPISILENGLRCEIVICTPEITIKLFEAANALLHEEGDAALVAVYTPETACTTTNAGVGWFVIEGNVPEDRVEDAYRESGQNPLRLQTRAAALTYLRESWRNFIHVRYEDGRQVVIQHPRMRHASRAAYLPLKKVKLTECAARGGQYMGEALRAAAADAVAECCHHATLTDRKGKEPANPLHDTKPLFFDHEGQLRFSELRERLAQSFWEVVGEDGSVWLQIEPDFLNALDAEDPRLILYQNAAGGAQDLVLKMGVTGTQMYEAYMERFVRALITTIYVCYGHNANAQQRGRPGRLHLAHMIYRGGMATISRRERAHYVLTKGYDWLARNIAEFPPDFKKLWDSAEFHRRQKQCPPAKHKDLLVAYTMNRPSHQFIAVESYLNTAYSRFIASTLNK